MTLASAPLSPRQLETASFAAGASHARARVEVADLDSDEFAKRFRAFATRSAACVLRTRRLRKSRFNHSAVFTINFYPAHG